MLCPLPLFDQSGIPYIVRSLFYNNGMKTEGETKQIKNFIYNTGDQIGKGFSSVVYKGTNIASKTPVAIKVIDLKSVKTEVEKRLLGNEMKALRMLQHDNIIQTYDIYQTANNAYLVSELCPYGDLTSYYQKETLSDQDIVRVLTGIVAGVQHLASKGIVHRDLKPANILIKDGTPKIIDFGFCDLKEDNQKGEKMKYNVGSPLYMSPEAYKTSNYSEKSDVWAIGVLLYEMILGKTPFKGIDYDSMVKSVASGEIYKQIQNGFFKMILSRMLSVDFQRRAGVSQVASLLSQNKMETTTKTVVRKPSGTTYPARSEVQHKPYVSLSKLPTQISPRKVQPIISADANKQPAITQRRIMSSIQSGRPERTSKKVEQPVSALTDYLVFLYRVCKITKGQSGKSTFVQRIHHLTLCQLKSILKQVQQQPVSTTPQYFKVASFVKDAWSYFSIGTYSNDLYFSNVCNTTLNWFSETASDYLQFWLKMILSQQFQQFSRVQNTEAIDASKFQMYLYCSSFCNLISRCRGRSKREFQGLIEQAGLSKLLKQKKVVNQEAVQDLNIVVKAMI